MRPQWQSVFIRVSFHFGVFCEIVHRQLIYQHRILINLVAYCLFSVCKSCLVKHLEENNTCPSCGNVIHQSHPLQYISFDRTMQDIVYKLVPNLQEGMLLSLISLLSPNICGTYGTDSYCQFQMKWNANETSTKTAIFRIRRICRKTMRTTLLIGWMNRTLNLTIIVKTNRSTFVSSVWAPIWMRWNDVSYGVAHRRPLHIWKNLWPRKY